ncbi:MAG: class I SAM-dependent methyltransferase [Planctomycetota bacterium]|jgi:cyclopropane-fatty-acyl-phospholipid synthase
MSTIIPGAVAAPSNRRHKLADRAARAIVRRRLAGLTGGEVCVSDGPSTFVSGHHVGDDDALSATITVRDPRFYRRLVLGGSLGAAESFIEGLWTADDLTSLLRIFVRDLALTDRIEGGAARAAAPLRRVLHRLRDNTRAGSRRNIHAHYDLGNELFALFLDETMTYSCGIFPTPEATMREASIAKLDRICRKIGLRPEHHLLEIGTGWGSFAIHAARTYGCRVTTTTISREQHALAVKRVAAAGLDDRVEVRLSDYRDLDGVYDRIVSIEMIEAVGHRFLDDYFRQCSRRLRPDGLMALQAITMPDQRYEAYRRSVDFIQKYVFPGSCVPSPKAMGDAIARATNMRQVHLEDITPHYVTTLQRWRDRFRANLEGVRRLGYPAEFVRLWEFYLAYCEAGFAERYIGTVQMVLAKPGSRHAPILGAMT